MLLFPFDLPLFKKERFSLHRGRKGNVGHAFRSHQSLLLSSVRLVGAREHGGGILRQLPLGPSTLAKTLGKRTVPTAAGSELRETVMSPTESGPQQTGRSQNSSGEKAQVPSRAYPTANSAVYWAPHSHRDDTGSQSPAPCPSMAATSLCKKQEVGT